MKLGYPCINNSLVSKGNRTFRLKNYSHERLKDVVKNNLECLIEILKFNLENNIFFFRITSDLIPFASHPIMDFEWEDYYKTDFQLIGNFIKNHDFRITLHPGQYTVINSLNMDIFKKSVKELEYHVKILDLMNLNSTAKVQIHVGGIYNDKETSINRFIQRYNELDGKIINRLVIENDEKSYSLNDCLKIYKKIEIPVIFDVYHHDCLNNGESLEEAFEIFIKTWKKKDGLPIVHYSTQKVGGKKGNHAFNIDLSHFKTFITLTKKFDFDIMLEIKDKESSALKALTLIAKDQRFFKNR